MSIMKIFGIILIVISIGLLGFGIWMKINPLKQENPQDKIISEDFPFTMKEIFEKHKNPLHFNATFSKKIKSLSYKECINSKDEIDEKINLFKSIDLDNYKNNKKIIENDNFFDVNFNQINFSLRFFKCSYLNNNDIIISSDIIGNSKNFPIGLINLKLSSYEIENIFKFLYYYSLSINVNDTNIPLYDEYLNKINYSFYENKDNFIFNIYFFRYDIGDSMAGGPSGYFRIQKSEFYLNKDNGGIIYNAKFISRSI